MIDLPADQLEVVRSILISILPDAEVWVFGSRAKGKAEEFSDLDLAIVSKDGLPLKTLGSLRDAFSESDLPMKVDIVDFASASTEFQKVIMEDHSVFQKP